MSDSDLEAYYNECNEQSSSDEDLPAADWHSGPAVSPVRGGARSLTPSRIRGSKGRAEGFIQRSSFASSVAAQLTSNYRPLRNQGETQCLVPEATRQARETCAVSFRLIASVKQTCASHSPHLSWSAVRASMGSVVEDLEAAASSVSGSRSRIELAEKLRWICEVYTCEGNPVDALLLRALHAEEECDSTSFAIFTSFFVIALFTHLHDAFSGDTSSLPVLIRDVSRQPATGSAPLPVQYVRSQVVAVLASWCRETKRAINFTVPSDTEAQALLITSRCLVVESTNMLGVSLSARFQPGAMIFMDRQEGLMQWLRRTVMAPLEQLSYQLNKAAVRKVHSDGEGSKRIFSVLRDVVFYMGMGGFAAKVLEEPSHLDRTTIAEMGTSNTASQGMSSLFAEVVGSHSSVVQLVALPSAQGGHGSQRVISTLKSLRLAFAAGPHRNTLLTGSSRMGCGWRQMTTVDPYSALFSTLVTLSMISECANAKWKLLSKCESMGESQHTLSCVRHLSRACVVYVTSECHIYLNRFIKASLHASSVSQIERASIDMEEGVMRVLFLDDNTRLCDAFNSLLFCMLRSVLDGTQSGIDEVVAEFVTESGNYSSAPPPSLRHLLTQITFNHYYTL